MQITERLEDHALLIRARRRILADLDNYDYATDAMYIADEDACWILWELDKELYHDLSGEERLRLYWMTQPRRTKTTK